MNKLIEYCEKVLNENYTGEEYCIPIVVYTNANNSCKGIENMCIHSYLDIKLIINYFTNLGWKVKTSVTEKLENNMFSFTSKCSIPSVDFYFKNY